MTDDKSQIAYKKYFGCGSFRTTIKRQKQSQFADILTTGSKSNVVDMKYQKPYPTLEVTERCQHWRSHAPDSRLGKHICLQNRNSINYSRNCVSHKLNG